MSRRNASARRRRGGRLDEGFEARAGRAEKRLTLGMAAAAVMALGALLADYGSGPGPLRPLWREVETGCAFIFVLLQCAKPATVPRPFAYLKEHRLDYVLIAILLFGVAGASALRQSPEFRYLIGHGAHEPLEALPVLAIQGYLVFLVVLKSPWFQRALLALPLGAATALWTSFAALIGAGTILLRLPGAAAPGRSTTWVQALFTATSAACVTGLTTVDTGTHWSGFGQAVILGLIQLGGLGLLTLTGSVALLAGRALSEREHTGLAEISEADALPQVRSALFRPLLLTVLIEAAGAALLFLVWRDPDQGIGRRIWLAIFHAVSAFCNAGFSLHADGLARHMDDAATLLIIGALVVAGGIGFGVAWDLCGAAARRGARRRSGPLSPQAKAALRATAVLIVAGGLGLWAIERGGVFSAAPRGTRLMNALFLSISSRTAGFQTVDLAGLTLPASALLVLLMLIGGAPGSTAGGIKTTTLWTLLDRRSPPWLRLRALVVALALPAAFIASGLLLRWTTGGAVHGTWFESASAVGTVGLSRGITPGLPAAAQIVLVATMLFGRLGPFVIAFSLRRRSRRAGVPVEQEPYLIG
ncbi:MAG: TrkH family potassium uptake protein [Acidobacteria bacterium]|nr:TrkH family potassium uptake protein [Acidobacteriota bacterium]